MAVEKMYFTKITGPIKELDAYVIKHIVPNEIQLVRSTSVLDVGLQVSQYDEQNPYDRLLKKIQILCKDMNAETKDLSYVIDGDFDTASMESEVVSLLDEYEALDEKRKSLGLEKNHKEQIKKQISLIQSMDVEVSRFFDFHFMKFRFGKMPIETFEKAKSLQLNLDFIMYEVTREVHDVFVVYFMPRMVQPEIDKLFASLFFNRIRLSDEIHGYPKEAMMMIADDLIGIQQQLDRTEEEIRDYIAKNQEKVKQYYGLVHQLSMVFTARQYAVHTKKTFVLMGWIPSSNLENFMESMKSSKAFSYEVEDEEAENMIMPPTRLKNRSFFKPFEVFINMYAVPSYNEIDPTPFVGITYMLVFALMFGDLGQGLVISVLGFLLYRKTKAALAHVAIYLGLCSAITGVFYGSLFGNEEILREHLSFIPMFEPLDNINTVLLGAVILGVILIICAMVINLINSLKSKNIGRLLFDRNGLVGLLLYFSILFIVLNTVMKYEMTALPALILIITSLGVIFLSHPLQKLIRGKKEIFPKDKVGFIVESLFELIETILSILSNTISFVRVGAFALNHVGFFMAFHILSDMVSAAAGKTAIMILGNIVIIVLEGLIVGIQSLRLEYYELFSRFFDGQGSEYKPFISIKNN